MLNLNCDLMSCDCQCSVALPRGSLVGLQCVIAVFPDNTHYFSMTLSIKSSLSSIKIRLRKLSSIILPACNALYHRVFIDFPFKHLSRHTCLVLKYLSPINILSINGIYSVLYDFLVTVKAAPHE